MPPGHCGQRFRKNRAGVWPMWWAYWSVDRLVRGPSGRLCFMDFAYDDRTQDLRERLLAFRTKRVSPAEPVFREQEETAEAAGRIWERLPVTAELKAEA